MVNGAGVGLGLSPSPWLHWIPYDLCQWRHVRGSEFHLDPRFYAWYVTTNQWIGTRGSFLIGARFHCLTYDLLFQMVRGVVVSIHGFIHPHVTTYGWREF
jgi:hypothetical protein